MIRVDVPEHGTFVDFPDGTPPAEIEQVLAQNFPPVDARAKFIEQESANSEAVKGMYRAGTNPSKSSLLRRAVGDTAISALKGAIGFPESVVGLADIVTGGMAGQAAEKVGYRPKEAKAILDTMYSPEQQEANAAVQSAEGFVPTIKAAVQNPSTIFHSAVESAPSMIGGAGIARGGMKVLPKLAPVVAGALGEGAISAGQTAEQVRQEDPEGRLSLKQSALAAGSGALTGAISLVGGKVAQKLGITDIDTYLASGAAPQAKAGLVKSVAEGLVSEGLEESAQSAQEQIAQNVAQGKPWNEGVGNATAMGGITGGVMGGGGNVIGHGAPAPHVVEPAGPLSRAVSRAAAPVQGIGSLVAERRGMAAPAAQPVAPVETPVQPVAPVAEAQPVAAPAPVTLTQQPFIPRGAAPVASISDMVGASRDRATTIPANDGIAPVQPTAPVATPAVATETPAVNPVEAPTPTQGVTNETANEVRQDERQYANGQEVHADGETAQGDAAAVVQAVRVGEDAKRDEGSVTQAATPAVSPLDANAHEAAASPHNETPEPTPAQIEAGNYKKGHINLHGLDISIENPHGSTRKGVDPNGKPWETTMNGHYGYIKGTVGKDKDHVDVFIKPGIDQTTAGDRVFVVDQIDPQTGKLDEHKVLMGYQSADEAKAGYLANYDATGPDRIGALTETTVPEFKSWLKDGDTKKEFTPTQETPHEAHPALEVVPPIQPPTAADEGPSRGILQTLAKPKKKSDASIASLAAQHGKDAVNRMVTSGYIAFPGRGMAELTKKGRAWLSSNPEPLSPLETTQLAKLAKNKKRSEKQESKFQELSARQGKVAPASMLATAGTNDDTPSEPLTHGRVKASFPNQEVSEDNGAYVVKTPSGVTVRISKVGSIEFDRKAAELAYGREILPGEVPVAEFKALPSGAVINLTERGVGSLDHEVFHLAMATALTPKQIKAVLARFGTEENAAAEYQRLKDTGAFEEKKGHLFLNAIYRFFRNLRQLIAPTAKGVMQDVASGKVWEKAKQGESGPKYALSRADQTMTDEQKVAVEAAFGKPKTLKERAKEFKKDLRKNLEQGIFDQYAPIKDLDMGAYMKARMTKGGDSTLEAVMLYGKPYIDSTGSIKVDFSEKNNGQNGFASILAELDGEHDRFLKWVAGIRAGRLKDIGLENLMSKETIAALKTLNRDGTAENKLPNGEDRAITYMRVLNHMNAYNDAILKVAVERGLINDATRQMYKDMPYIPFYRLQDEGVVTGFTATAGLVNQTAWKKLKGGTNKLNDDMLANMLKNWSHLITASARNEAAAKTLTKAVEIGAAHEVPAGYPGKGVVSFRENTTTVLKKAPDDTYKRVQGEPLPQGTKYKEGGVDKVSDGTMVPEFNVERHFIVTDPHLLDAITSIGPATKAPKVLRGFKNVLTHAVTINPTFKIRNLIRDSVSSVALADMSYNPVKNVKKGFALTAHGSKTRAQMMAAGGIMRFGSMLDGASADNARKLIDKGVPAEHILDSPNKVSAFWKKYVVGAFDAYQEFGDRSEQVNRAALYQTLLEKGYTADEAAFWARDLMDFSMSGKWAAVRFLTQTVPFMNARLQGLYKLGRAAKTDRKRFAYVIGGVTLSSLALLAAYHDDDDWKKREAWDRDNYWWFKVGDKAFRIPKPFEIGAIGSVAEWSAELMFNDEMTGGKFAQRMRDIVSSQLSLNPTPQLVKPLIDLWANRDSFTNRPIETMGMDRLKPEDRYSDYTSGVAKVLGQLGLPNPAQVFMGRYEPLSPVQIDSLVRGYFSWLGVMATTALDYGVFKPLSGVASPTPKLKDVFMVGNFVEGLPSNSSRYVSEMYEQSKEIEQSYNSYRAAVKAGDTERAAKIMASDKDNIKKHMQTARIQEHVAELNRRIKQVTASRFLSGDQKREKIDALRQKQDAIARRMVR